MLRLDDVHAYYDESHVLHGMSFELRDGEVATLIGRNGVGKTTTLRSIMGIVRPRRGTIEFNGSAIHRLPSDRIARCGIAYVPEERGIFSSLSVRENLLFAPLLAPGGWTVDRIFDAFPNLKQRATAVGTTLSGGEQQMLAIARALMSRPRLLLLDEPSLGLAPLVVKQIFEVIAELNAREGLTVFLVEQNAFHALKLAHRGYVMVNGAITMQGGGAELLARPEVRSAYLEGGH
jgi:branched-chain amino acid transport system ATP-binding protein